MAHTRDYIPSRDVDFDTWFQALTSYVVLKTSGAAPAWTHIPAEAVRALEDAFAAWHRAFERAGRPHSPVETAAKNAARGTAVALIRPFVGQYLRYFPVTDLDRDAMGLHNRSGTYTRHSGRETYPVIERLFSMGGCRVRIWFRDESVQESHAVPYGCNGASLFYAWGPERLETVSALRETELMTRSPWVLYLPPEAEARYLSCAPRWQARKGNLGPWGPISHIVIA